MNGSLRERLYSRLMPCPEPGCDCLLWTGAMSNTGYGNIGFRADGRKWTAGVHTVAWELDNGPVPPGLEIDHVKARGCRHRHCANIAHLEAVTHRENTLRGDTIAAACAARTHCPQGHEYDLFNTYFCPDGSRRCRACNRLSKTTEEGRAYGRESKRRQRARKKVRVMASGDEDP